MPHGETPFPKSKAAQRRLFDQILQAGREGKSHAQIAEMIGVGREQLKYWIRENPDFAKVMTLADDYALAWWEALGQRQAETKEGNSSVFMFVMKNRFGVDYGHDANGVSQTPASGETVDVIAKLSPENRHALRALLKEAITCDDP